MNIRNKPLLRIAAWLLVVLVLALGLAACGDDDENGDQGESSAPAATAEAEAGGGLVVRDAWVRMTIGEPGAMAMDGTAEPEMAATEDAMAGEGMSATLRMAALMTTENTTDNTERLIAASADITGTVEIHETTMENDVMQMRPVEGIEIPANGSVELRTGGLHLMLLGLQEPLTEGQTVNLTLTFESGATLAVEAPVRGME